jgi:hypothetical protein
MLAKFDIYWVSVTFPKRILTRMRYGERKNKIDIKCDIEVNCVNRDGGF